MLTRHTLPAFALILSASVTAHADMRTLIIAADDWCPYNCDPDSGQDGMMVDISREAMELHGWKTGYRIISWKRAGFMVEKGEIDGLAGTSKSESSEKQKLLPAIATGCIAHLSR